MNPIYFHFSKDCYTLNEVAEEISDKAPYYHLPFPIVLTLTCIFKKHVIVYQCQNLQRYKFCYFEGLEWQKDSLFLSNLSPQEAFALNKALRNQCLIIKSKFRNIIPSKL